MIFIFLISPIFTSVKIYMLNYVPEIMLGIPIEHIYINDLIGFALDHIKNATWVVNKKNYYAAINSGNTKRLTYKIMAWLQSLVESELTKCSDMDLVPSFKDLADIIKKTPSLQFTRLSKEIIEFNLNLPKTNEIEQKIRVEFLYLFINVHIGTLSADRKQLKQLLILFSHIKFTVNVNRAKNKLVDNYACYKKCGDIPNETIIDCNSLHHFLAFFYRIRKIYPEPYNKERNVIASKTSKRHMGGLIFNNPNLDSLISSIVQDSDKVFFQSIAI